MGGARCVWPSSVGRYRCRTWRWYHFPVTALYGGFCAQHLNHRLSRVGPGSSACHPGANVAHLCLCFWPYDHRVPCPHPYPGPSYPSLSACPYLVREIGDLSSWASGSAFDGLHPGTWTDGDVFLVPDLHVSSSARQLDPWIRRHIACAETSRRPLRSRSPWWDVADCSAVPHKPQFANGCETKSIV